MQIVTKFLAITFCGVVLAQNVEYNITAKEVAIVTAMNWEFTKQQRKEMGLKEKPTDNQRKALGKALGELGDSIYNSVHEIEQNHRAESNAAMLFSGYTCGMVRATGMSRSSASVAAAKEMKKAALDNGVDCDRVDGLIEKMSADMR
jgi:hypothetical protein